MDLFSHSLERLGPTEGSERFGALEVYLIWAYLRLAGHSLSSFEFSGILYVTH